MEQDTTYVAFDTSKETIAVALAESGRRREVRFFGTIASRPDGVRKLVEKLARRHKRLVFCYEAGPTGYGLYRQIKAMGHECQVVAPSMVPPRPAVHSPKPSRSRQRTTTCRLNLEYGHENQKTDQSISNPHGIQDPVSPYEVLAGTVITASLITGISSDLPIARERRRDADPGAANALVARVVEAAGFRACYVTGAGIANTFLGRQKSGSSR